jgi:hypothetical protein
MRRRWSALAAVTAAVLVVLPSGARAQSATPTATVDTTTAALGQRVLVQGDGWAPGTQAHLEVCGNAATNLSADCDLIHGVDAGVGSDGHFSTLLTVADPGKPCPCVVRVTDSESSGIAVVAIDIVGLSVATPTATPLPDLSSAIEVIDPHVVGHGDWTAWFGAGSHRSFVFTVRNKGAVALRDPPLSIVFGRGNDPHGFVAAPKVGDLEPGQLKTFQVPVSVDLLTWGDFTVRGDIGNVGPPVVFLARTSNRPWGLVVLGLVFLQLLLLALRNIVRRRLHREVDEEEAPTVEEAEEAVAVVEVVEEPEEAVAVVEVLEEPVVLREEVPVVAVEEDPVVEAKPLDFDVAKQQAQDILRLAHEQAARVLDDAEQRARAILDAARPIVLPDDLVEIRAQEALAERQRPPI